jgi:hypothetical protein
MVPQHDLSPRQLAWMRARAKAERLGTTPYPVFDDRVIYAVRSSAGGLYFVRRDEHGTRYSCECPAGEQGIPCYHAAAVAALPEEIERRAGYRLGHTTEQTPA